MPQDPRRTRGRREGAETPDADKRFWLKMGNVFYYALLVVILMAIFMGRRSAAGSPSFFGYRLFAPLTTSMESVYPRGGVVVVKEGETVQVGDDVTFLISQEQTATHRCIEVIHDYEGTGFTVYRTQGVDNAMPDTGVVYEQNVVGKVVGYIPHLGTVSFFVQNYLLYFIVAALAIPLLFYAVRTFRALARDDEETEDEARPEEAFIPAENGEDTEREARQEEERTEEVAKPEEEGKEEEAKEERTEGDEPEGEERPDGKTPEGDE